MINGKEKPIFPYIELDLVERNLVLDEFKTLTPREYLDYVLINLRSERKSEYAYFFLTKIASSDYRDEVFRESEKRGVNQFQQTQVNGVSLDSKL